MLLVDAVPTNLTELVNADDIECECMLCHIPLSAKHEPVEWTLTFRFPGPFPEAGSSTMLLCDPCYRDWVEHPDDFGGFPESSHRI